ncbi:PVC-type heme-binding CxxCH protein [Mariniblastus fucicola]|uniref:FG-GAP repeat protein n=1 Tax=Mariniblastus fucicola TaxID=980251 RepID=A0A5B9PDC3_9BACT|nr:PVC-type heme-binding CxxCH protein [Mariniblastus fucicola]QEG24378.1 FG-GAP repeat protein [Mariniblastus fucicola]
MLLSQIFSLAFAAATTLLQSGGDTTIHTFERQQLSDIYFSEGADAADINGDGITDVVYGPYWFAGPDFKTQREIYKPVPQNRDQYADNFFSWLYDFNGDGRKDVFVVGFPGTPAYVYENPGKGGFGEHWPKHEVFDWVSNESPQLINIVGDERPELVCTRDGFFGFATIDWEQPFETWEFHRISGRITAGKFGHGLGIGDVNGDGRMDLIHSRGWFEQPLTHELTSMWIAHDVKLSEGYGGAEMYAYDVDGDGDNDIITSHNAHDFGLGWYEQIPGDKKEEPNFKHHLIMGEHPSENKYGVVFSEPHSLALADMDGDGLKDIVTGKTYWSHHRKSPMWDTGAVVYWFKLTRGDDGVDWVPHRIDGKAGIGRQVSIVDINDDKLPDVVLGGMVGAHVLTHRTRDVSTEEYAKSQPKIYDGPKLPRVDGARALRGPVSKKDLDTGLAANAIEGETLIGKATAGQVKPQDMAGFGPDWSHRSHLWWIGAKPSDRLGLSLPEFTGTVDIDVVLTCARDYGIVQLSLDDQPLGPPIDLFDPNVITTGVLSFDNVTVKGKNHKLNVQILGANPKAAKAYMFAIDFLRIKTADGKFVAGKQVDVPKVIKAKTVDGRELNLDFETGTLADWTAEGNAWKGQPIKGDTVSPRRSDMASNHHGDFWIGGFEKSGDKPKGILTSEPFVVSHRFASFLTNGGDSSDTRVELIRKATGEAFYTMTGNQSESMRQVIVDLRPYLGQEIMIRLVDNHDGHWGHLNFDHFRFHAKQPGSITPQSVGLTNDEYPHAGISAEKAAAAMKLPEGFSVTVGATEPQVQQPIAMAIDDRGRVWIAEAYEYPIRAKGDKGRDRILIFEDTDGNGSLDKRTVFHEGLNLVSGLEVGFGGVWVGAAPYLMFIPDRNGDDVPDAEPEILLDGWGYEDTHETLNAFIWGPDGWLYGCHGVFTHSKVGKPGTPDADRVPLNCSVWRYHPLQHEFEIFAHGTSNPWGVDFNDHGQAFITACVIPHLYHIIDGARYQRQGGRHFNSHTYRDITTIADHLHYLGATPHSGNSKSDAAGGGHAHAGAMIYLGGKWPKEYRNQIFMNNIHGQRLNVDVLTPNGSGYIGSHSPDFLLTGDQASQILNLRYGPDGDAWMIDWYDMQACHRRESELHDRTNGRIYKIQYGESNPSELKKKSLASRSDLELAKLVLQNNDWYVRHSRRNLQERSAKKAIATDAISFLADTLANNADDTRRLRAAWALSAIRKLTAADIEKMFADSSPYVRGWAVQLAMQQMPNSGEAFVSRFVELARSDDSQVVRLYLASAAQKLPTNMRWELLEALTSHRSDANDHNLPLMYWYAAEPLADEDTGRALALAMSAGEHIPLLREFMLRRIGSGGTETAMTALVEGLGDADSPKLQLVFLSAIRKALTGQRQVTAPKGWSKVSDELLSSSDTEVQLQATALGVTFGDEGAFAAMRSQIKDASRDLKARQVALSSLLDAGDPGLVSTLISLLDSNAALRADAIRGLAQYNDPRVAPSLLAAYSKLTPDQRRLALGTLCSRATTGTALLKAIEAKQIAGTDLTADLVRQLQFLKNENVNALLGTVWGTARESAGDKLKQIEDLKSLVAATNHPPADLQLGRSIYAKTCMKCHVLYGVGYKVGPDLTGSNRSNIDYLLSNIVDPSSVMAKEYQPTILATDDGRVLNGLVKAEDENSITLRTADSEVVVPKDEIEERGTSELSMMPADQLVQFSPHQIRSLIAYLQGKQQTAILASEENASTLFNGQNLTGWSGTEGLWSVEDGELVGRTEGLNRNEWLVSDLSVENFRLSLEVKLVNDEGNSGIQFRSKAHDGEVSGYQADIGKGWWGKLYEEHGRALLWDKSGEAHVKPGQWNRYEIVADGHHILTKINGQECVNLKDPDGANRGIIALQLHSGGKTEVRFRNFKLEVLPTSENEE